jgi:hypothetical protein
MANLVKQLGGHLIKEVGGHLVYSFSAPVHVDVTITGYVRSATRYLNAGTYQANYRADFSDYRYEVDEGWPLTFVQVYTELGWWYCWLYVRSSETVYWQDYWSLEGASPAGTYSHLFGSGAGDGETTVSAVSITGPES